MSSELVILAWYGFVLLTGQWSLVGPYPTRDDCTSVIEWLDTQGLETESCEQITTDVDAQRVQVGEIPIAYHWRSGEVTSPPSLAANAPGVLSAGRNL